MAQKVEEWVTVAIDVPRSRVKILWDVLEGEGINLRIFRSKDQPGNGPVPVYPEKRKWHRYPGSGDYALSFWPEIQVIFAKAPDRTLRYDDPELRNVLIKHGKQPSGIGPVLSELGRRGKLVKAQRGWWRMP
jgi:hypothetical protein